jgi:signal transduction histidine kinase
MTPLRVARYFPPVQARWRPSRGDVALAAAVIALAVLEVSVNPALAPRGPALAIEVALGAVLLARRRAPLPVVVAVAVLMVAEWLAGVPLVEPLVPLVAAVLSGYSAAVRCSAWPAAAAFVVLVAAAQIVSQGAALGNFLFGSVFVGGTFAVGRVVRRRTSENVELERAAGRAKEREAAALLTAAEERRRIARDMHDVISHSVSVMVIQAGGAAQVLESDSARAKEALEAVQRTGRQALGELSHLLGVLREHGEEIGLEPQPGLGDVDALIDRARSSGVAVEVRREGATDGLPPGIELSIYRILQESLTNVLKHSGAKRARILLRYRTDGVELEVSDEGPAPTSAGVPSPATEGGHGLIGMQERVGAYGGTLQAGPQENGGYRVRALIPVESS